MEARAGNPRLKLLLDEHISVKVADRLNGLGHDVVGAAADPLLQGSSDSELFSAAQQQDRILVTYNRSDFEAIALEYANWEREHHGLVLVHHARFPSSEFNRLAKALDRFVPPAGGSFVVWLQP